jgi:glycerol-3-phosphate acyltransferase PlsY
VLGHVTSPFLRGRGGKGVATTAGAVLGSQPLWAPVLVLVWLAVLGASRWIALASMTAAASLLVVALVAQEDRLWAAGLALVVLVRHRANVLKALALRRHDE